MSSRSMSCSRRCGQLLHRGFRIVSSDITVAIRVSVIGQFGAPDFVAHLSTSLHRACTQYVATARHSGIARFNRKGSGRAIPAEAEVNQGHPVRSIGDASSYLRLDAWTMVTIFSVSASGIFGQCAYF